MLGLLANQAFFLIDNLNYISRHCLSIVIKLISTGNFVQMRNVSKIVCCIQFLISQTPLWPNLKGIFFCHACNYCLSSSLSYQGDLLYKETTILFNIVGNCCNFLQLFTYIIRNLSETKVKFNFH